MEFTAEQIAAYLSGTVEGDINAIVTNITRIEEGASGMLSFLSNPKYTPYIYETKSSIVIVNNDFVAEKPIAATLIRVEDAYASFAKLLTLYQQHLQNSKEGVSERAVIGKGSTYGAHFFAGEFVSIGENCQIGENVKIYPQVYIGDNCQIGDNTVIYAGAKLYSDTQVGKSVTIHSGAVIGADGFGFAPNSENEYHKVPQIGNVILEDYVDIGANATVDRATIGSTIVRRGVKLDNMVHVAHNVEIGENTVIAAQTGISGSTKIGRDCMFGGQVGIAGHLRVADKVKLGAQTGVGVNLRKEGEVYMGSPSSTLKEYKRWLIETHRIEQLTNRIAELEKILKEKDEK